MTNDPGRRRSRGTGSLFVRDGAWYGKWRVAGRQVKRRLGPIRKPGTREGLTRPQAERELRRRIETEIPTFSIESQHTVTDAGERLIDHLGALGRKPTTLGTYRSLLRTHLGPRLDANPLDQIVSADVERLVTDMRRAGTGPKTTSNALTLLHQIFSFGQRNRWCADNPCVGIPRPTVEQTADIRFLAVEELEALIRSTSVADALGQTDRTLFLCAAMTGLRQGELLALRWRDIDWPASRVRVRQNYVRGHWGTPKSRRGSRSVPMTDRVAAELDRHFERSSYQADDDLVFAHPQTGDVLDHSRLVRRFKKALKAAGLGPVRFNDLRHTFGTRMAASGVPLRTLQEWMGHRDFKTTLIYADYAPSEHEVEMAERAFAPGTKPGTKLSESESIAADLKPLEQAEANPEDHAPQG